MHDFLLVADFQFIEGKGEQATAAQPSPLLWGWTR